MNIDSKEITEINRILKKFKQKKTKEEIFYNVCFCVLIPQSKFTTVLKTVSWLKEIGFYPNSFSPTFLLRETAFKARFKKRKASYLYQMRQNFDQIYEILMSRMKPDDKREWIKDNIYGLGYKTSSHLLRNLGYQNFAILDSHILKFLNYPKSNYLEIEKDFRNLAKAHNLTPAQFDGILWKRAAGVTENEFQY
jgi:N-glycosylase/DNA lyase